MIFSRFSILGGGLAILLAVSFGTVCHASDGGETKAETGAPSYSVSIRNGLVSVAAEGAPLTDVLESLAGKAGFELIMPADESDTISHSFKDRTIPEAVTEATRGRSTVVFYGPDNTTLEAVILLNSQIGDSDGLRLRVSLASREGQRRRREREAILVDVEYSVGELASIIYTERDPTIRMMAVMGLSRTQSERSKDALTTALHDDEAVASEAITVLGRFWRADAREALTDVSLNHPNFNTRARAALMLETIDALGAAEK